MTEQTNLSVVKSAVNASSSFTPDTMVLHRYKMIRSLGEKGSCCCVDTVSGKEVFLKVLPVEISSNPWKLENVNKKFTQLSAVGQEGIVVYNSMDKDWNIGRHYLISEFVKDEKLSGLKDRFKGNDALISEAGYKFLRQLAEYLDLVHSKGIIHGEVSPENIAVSASSDAILFNFNLANTLNMESNSSIDHCDYRYFASPEAWHNELLSAESDQYSLAAVIYWMVCGQPPYDGNSVFDVRAKVVDGKIDMEKFPASVAEVIATAMNKERGKRFAGCAAFIAELQKCGFFDVGAEAAVSAEPESVSTGNEPQKNTVGNSGKNRAVPDKFKACREQGITFSANFEKLIKCGDISIRSCEIPEGVKIIGANAFRGCTNLNSVLLPSTIVEIRRNAFAGCLNLQMDLPPNVRKIGFMAFSKTPCGKKFWKKHPALMFQPWKRIFSWLAICVFALCFAVMYCHTDSGDPQFEIENNILIKCGNRDVIACDIPDGVTEINSGAFKNCREMRLVTIPGSVKKIGNDAFAGCTGLISVSIPSSVEFVGRGAFSGCTGLKEVEIPNVGGDTSIVWDDVFVDCPNLQEVEFISGTRKIGDGALQNCATIQRVVLPESVEKVGSRAFANCSLLKNVNIPSGLTSIGEAAFSNCRSLSAVALPPAVKFLPESIFENCVNMSSLLMPGVTGISNRAFYNCERLQFDVLPPGIRKIGSQAFVNCSGLTAVTLNNSIEKVENSAFKDCRNLTSVTVPGRMNIEESGKGAWGMVFENCPLIREVTLPAKTVEVGNGEFAGFSGLDKVNIPDSVMRIGALAFDNCYNIREIAIPDGVLEIGAGAFRNCGGLTEVIIPEGVKRIYPLTFKNCSSLSRIEFKSGRIKLEKDAFADCPSLAEIVIPADCDFSGILPPGCKLIRTGISHN